MRLFGLFDAAVQKRLGHESITAPHLITECFFSYQDLNFNQEIVETFEILNYYRDYNLESFLSLFQSTDTPLNQLELIITCKTGRLALLVSRFKKRNKKNPKYIVRLSSKSQILDFLLRLKLIFGEEYQIKINKNLLKYNNEIV